ncbi:hypothetical protein [Actibacterium mucosum]|uniref:hypothetical protein n=1 Tax=Actibacterium mucosum TaxID=1087332 RepID=UPI001268628F|nr:hypothetical protein [Actibacterium mucosum]
MKSLIVASALMPGALYAFEQSAYITTIEIPPCHFGGGYNANGKPCGFSHAFSEADLTPVQRQAAFEHCTDRFGEGAFVSGWLESNKPHAHASKIVTGENGLQFDITLPVYRYTPECSEPGKELQ